MMHAFHAAAGDQGGKDGQKERTPSTCCQNVEEEWVLQQIPWQTKWFDLKQQQQQWMPLHVLLNQKGQVRFYIELIFAFHRQL